MFYDQLLRQAFPNYVGFSITNPTVTIGDLADNYPVRMDFEAVGRFELGTDPPSKREVFEALQTADLNTYIQNYVWNTEPLMNNLFWNTQRARYDASISTTERNLVGI